MTRLYIATHEKVATIVEAQASGRLGTYTPLSSNKAVVEADGFTFIVEWVCNRWRISLNGLHADGSRLDEAARLAFQRGQGTHANRQLPSDPT